MQQKNTPVKLVFTDGTQLKILPIYIIGNMSEIKLTPLQNDTIVTGKDPIGKLVRKLGILGIEIRRDDVLCQNENEVCLLLEYRKKRAEKLKVKAARDLTKS